MGSHLWDLTGFDVCVFFSTWRNGPGSIGRIFQAEESKAVSKGQCTLWLDLNKRRGGGAFC